MIEFQYERFIGYIIKEEIRNCINKSIGIRIYIPIYNKKTRD